MSGPQSVRDLGLVTGQGVNLTAGGGGRQDSFVLTIDPHLTVSYLLVCNLRIDNSR